MDIFRQAMVTGGSSFLGRNSQCHQGKWVCPSYEKCDVLIFYCIWTRMSVSYIIIPVCVHIIAKHCLVISTYPKNMKVIADHRPFSMFLTYKNMNETTPSPKKRGTASHFLQVKWFKSQPPPLFRQIWPWIWVRCRFPCQQLKKLFDGYVSIVRNHCKYIETSICF